jgi:Na+-transporting NADH:ubiquinone oxidoreductase subunit A
MDIRIKKTWTIPPYGRPSSFVKDLPPPSLIASVPDKMPFISPRLLVKVGDHVDIGTPLFEDKNNPYIKFLSPGGGSISSINYGPRRAIREIIIAVDPIERHVTFRAFDIRAIGKIKQKEFIDHLVAGGVWPYIRELPFRKIADPYKSPPAIWVYLDSPEPYQLFSEIYLKDNISVFELGMNALKKISNMIHVCQHASCHQED